MLSLCIAASFSVFTGCNKNERTVAPPVFTSTMEHDIVASPSGGRYDITYSIENPVEGGLVSASVDEDCDWIDNFNTDKCDTVSFTVTPNTIIDSREAEITVTYFYSGGEPQSFKVKVNQTKSGSPDLILTSDDKINAGYEGGVFVVTYSLENPADGGELKVMTDADWITDIDKAESGIVKFNVLSNSGDMREGKIDITYTWPDVEQILIITVTVVQEGGIKDYSDAFTINVPSEDIMATSARVITSCNYPELYWTAQIIKNDDFIEYAGGNVDNMKDYFMSMLEEALDHSVYPTFDQFLPYFLYNGDYIDNYTYTGLDPETEYMTYAVGMDYNANYTTEFIFGPSFTTPEVQLSDLKFDIEVLPEMTNVTLNIYPTDETDTYIATVIDGSWYEKGYTNEEIMDALCKSMGFNMYYNALTGIAKDYVVQGLMQGTQYYAVAFGVNLYNYSYTSEMTVVPFETLEGEVSGAYATMSMDEYWDIDDLVSYNPEYDDYRDVNPLLVPIVVNANEYAAEVWFYVYDGDVSEYGVEMLREDLLTSGNAYYVVPRDGFAVQMTVADYGTSKTVVAVSIDENGNLGLDTFMEVFSFTESGVSKDFAQFDEYFNAFMNGYYFSPAKSMNVVHSCSKELEKSYRLVEILR